MAPKPKFQKSAPEDEGWSEWSQSQAKGRAFAQGAVRKGRAQMSANTVKPTSTKRSSTR